MRMRHKPYAQPELDACDFYVKDPTENLGHWYAAFENPAPLHLELGCGKGGFIAALASKTPDVNYIAIDLTPKVLIVAKRKIEALYQQLARPVSNLKILTFDIARIAEMMNEADAVDRIYINFCNPWPKGRHNKRRLTHPRQLEGYKPLLKDGGEIYFKTDDDNLFADSLEYFAEAGFTLTYTTYDLHTDAPAWNIMTEHEKMFSDAGILIKALIAKKA